MEYENPNTVFLSVTGTGEHRQSHVPVSNELMPKHDDTCSEHDDKCLICHSKIEDPCHVAPCGHRLGCHSCVCTGLNTLQKCWLCRQSVVAVVQESTGKMLTVPTTQSDVSFNLARRRLDSTNVTMRPRTLTATEGQILRRMYIYHHRLFSRHVGANARSGYREITPHVFRNDPELRSRAKAFLRRELRVFAYIGTSNGMSRFVSQDGNLSQSPFTGDDPVSVREVEANVRYFICILKTVDLKGSSGKAESVVRQQLRTPLRQMEDATTVVNLFIHELRAFLMSPYARLKDWDASVQYDEPRRGAASVPRIYTGDSTEDDDSSDEAEDAAPPPAVPTPAAPPPAPATPVSATPASATPVSRAAIQRSIQRTLGEIQDITFMMEMRRNRRHGWS